MSKFISIAKTSDIKPGQMKTFTVNRVDVLVANVEGTFFATQDLCTHDDGTLRDGELVHDQIECPRHGGRFNVKTGAATAMPAMFPIKTFPVKIEGDQILVALD
jgi:3-phenylpropionate/trans-cinnamate dioxygenase ferredoxin component